ncbi:MAG TPA: DUF6049 family protein, partial [Actinomycetota bacterium]|nr:DUF6049 family protein [Actinomycetota bacterium]
ELDVEVRAENLGFEPIGELSIGWTLWGPVFERLTYERSLVADPEDAVFIDGDTLPRKGTIEPGRSRVFTVRLALDSEVIATDTSLIYPLKIDLRSGFTSLAAIRTPVIFLVRQPEIPLNLAWTFVLHEPIGFGPDGVFTSTALEQELATGGGLAGEIRSLLTLTEDGSQTPIGVAVSPALLTNLVRMRDGYAVMDEGERRQVKVGEGGAAAAAQALVGLRQIAAAPEVELSALPFAAPSLPALAASGLSADLTTQLERGRQTVATALGRTPNPAILRPPGSAVDQASLDQLPGQGVTLLLLDDWAAPPPPQPLGFVAPPTTSLPAGGGEIAALVSDADVQALFGWELMAEDPVLGAQAILGELAQIWLEQPGVERGIAVTFPDAFGPPGAFFGPLVRGIAAAPWVRKTTATALSQAFPPPGPGQLAPALSPTFPPEYVETIKQTRRRIGIYRSMLVAESDEPDRLETLLLLAESGQFLGDQTTGSWFARYARDSVGAVFNAIRPDTDQVITLTSSAGTGIPMRVTNGNDEPVRVTIRLVSPHLQGTPESSMVLDARSTRTVNFDVSLTTTGRFPVNVQIASPSGRMIGESTLIVRSTAYNRIALIITFGAAAVALLVWARRFLPRRTG